MEHLSQCEDLICDSIFLSTFFHFYLIKLLVRTEVGLDRFNSLINEIIILKL